MEVSQHTFGFWQSRSLHGREDWSDEEESEHCEVGVAIAIERNGV
jgi:hypothetical protein